jgi:transposase
MDRYVLTDAQRAKMEPHCRGKKSDPDRSGSDNRRFVEAVLWIARTGSPWRDLPTEFGGWNTVFKRFRDWVKPMFSKDFSMRPRRNRTSSTPWSTPPSSKSTATDKAAQRMARPVCKQFRRSDLSSLHQRIRSQGRTLAKMEIRASRAS